MTEKTSHPRNFSEPSDSNASAVDSGPGLSKARTGITGLDEILGGGIPESSVTLVSGGPGTGKTIIALEFLYRGAVDGYPGIYITFEEKKSVLQRNAMTLGWDLADLERQRKLLVIEGNADPQAVLSGDFNLQGIIAILRSQTRAVSATRIVFDAPDVVLRLLGNETRERSELYVLNEWVRGNAMTAVVTAKTDPAREHANRYDYLDFISDCVIWVDQRVEEQVTTRRMRVVKYRGSSYGRNEYPFAITGRGIHVIPITAADLSHLALGPPVSSGIPRLDEILGGGYRRGSCTLLSGSSGTGKTTAACSFVQAACARDEKVLYINFEESLEAIVSGMLSPGIDLRPAIDKGLLAFVSKMPEAMGVEEHLILAFGAVERHQPQHVVVDAISACRRMGTHHSAFDYLLRLIDYCKRRGVTSFLTNLTSSIDRPNEITGIDLSSVIDTVIQVRHTERHGEMNRSLVIIKSRGRHHSHKVWEFAITDTGIEIRRPVSGEGSSEERR